jgi:hypothetical protein
LLFVSLLASQNLVQFVAILGNNPKNDEGNQLGRRRTGGKLQEKQAKAADAAARAAEAKRAQLTWATMPC